MNQRQKLKSNGYGSYINKIVVRVDIEHVDTFAEAFSTTPFRTAPEHSDFIVQTSARSRGDDETIMYTIDCMLPDIPPFKGWRVLWDESSY